VQIAREPVAAWSCFIDQDEVCGLRLARAGEVSDVGLSCADGPEGDDRGAVLWSDRGDRDGVFRDISANVKRARLAHG
jgi:hypothetical protein